MVENMVFKINNKVDEYMEVEIAKHKNYLSLFNEVKYEYYKSEERQKYIDKFKSFSTLDRIVINHLSIQAGILSNNGSQVISEFKYIQSPINPKQTYKDFIYQYEFKNKVLQNKKIVIPFKNKEIMNYCIKEYMEETERAKQFIIDLEEYKRNDDNEKFRFKRAEPTKAQTFDFYIKCEEVIRRQKQENNYVRIYPDNVSNYDL